MLNHFAGTGFQLSRKQRRSAGRQRNPRRGGLEIRRAVRGKSTAQIRSTKMYTGVRIYTEVGRNIDRLLTSRFPVRFPCFHSLLLLHSRV